MNYNRFNINIISFFISLIVFGAVIFTIDIITSFDANSKAEDSNVIEVKNSA